MLMSMQKMVGGLVGLSIAMLLETLLLILRTSFPPELAIEKRHRRQYQAQRRGQPQQQPGRIAIERSSPDAAAAEKKQQ